MEEISLCLKWGGHIFQIERVMFSHSALQVIEDLCEMVIMQSHSLPDPQSLPQAAQLSNPMTAAPGYKSPLPPLAAITDRMKAHS